MQGCSNKQIASQLNIAFHTVKSHVHNVLAKLDLNSRLEVAAFSRKAAGVGRVPSSTTGMTMDFLSAPVM